MTHFEIQDARRGYRVDGHSKPIKLPAFKRVSLREQKKFFAWNNRPDYRGFRTQKTTGGADMLSIPVTPVSLRELGGLIKARTRYEGKPYGALLTDLLDTFGL